MKLYPVRFACAFALVAVCAFGSVVAVGAQVKAGLSRPAHTQSRHSHACVSVGCAKLGDHVAYVLDGVVTQVDASQPGVICVRVGGSKTHGGDFCAVAK